MTKPFQKILVVQTAFIGDVILATGVLEKLHQYYPQAQLDFLVRKGNEGLVKNHPFLNQTLVWNKKAGKYKNLLKMLKTIRSEQYDLVVNIQRFANSGFLTAFSRAKIKIGFDKNPFSWAFNKKVLHLINNRSHEIERNHNLIAEFTDEHPAKPKLYPSTEDFDKARKLKTDQFICFAPASVWFTKQYPKEKWIEFLAETKFDGLIYALGAPTDKALCDEIIEKSGNSNAHNLCGKLSLLESAALMHDAQMNYVNDSAPMHLASAMNAPTAAIFCSTIPEFGFGPLSDDSRVIQIQKPLACRPCGLHGKKSCPEGHFKCGFEIEKSQLLKLVDY
ncbi:glycosyltransferase family 9 protein [uncultured Roseivirga sp.]|uniref:glycosyltransferase family 9 protein n=1 Tax=uncultured Roseivirga sp. TaxID=543088 RepID=UPI000D7ABE73|nr:glycosyltransferase family 9 protein [uncultured Roseivirga sp.]PWL31239.1 MAG: heptosyltransferase [Roseivirga sp. XM-24bin3]